ncbi:hypothetical protein HIM_02523 [Hirsutella minnesotensis 3608]|nr:hypothetical protein HIM_02523 [Hirsutella minnesotensis 3608]
MATLVGESHIKGSTETARMVLLTFVAIGITYVLLLCFLSLGASFTWGVELTYCTPYLLKLGLTKSNTSLTWIAGPLSGLVVQPIVGVIADENTSSWGRRRPLMMGAAAVVALGLVLMGFTRELVGLVVGADDELARRPTIVLAVLSIYVVDFAINVVQSCARSLVVDTLPIERQQTGAAWTSRMSAIGHVIGYAAGAVDLIGIFGTALGDSQFKQLTVLAILAMLGSTSLTCWAVTERILVAPEGSKSKSIGHVLRQIVSTLRHLTPRIQAICWAQFWAWIGSTSLFIYSGITTLGAIVLPLLVKSPDDDGYTHRPPPAIAGLVKSWNDKKPDLVTTWMCSHLVFAASMFLAPLAKSFRFATLLMCLCALPWTVATWAPPALLGVEVNRLSGAADAGGAYRRVAGDPDIEMTTAAGTGHGLPRQDSPTTTLGRSAASPKSSTAELSGIYFGILNIYTALPQFIGAFIASIIFAVLEPGKSRELASAQHNQAPPPAPGREGPSAIAACLFVGAMSALVAAVATRKLRRS